MRIKVLQLLYSLERAGIYDPHKAQSQVLMALEHTYRLYRIMALLPYLFYRQAERRLEQEQEKRFPSTEYVQYLQNIIHSRYVALILEESELVEQTMKLLPQTDRFMEYISQSLTSLWRDFPELRPVDEEADFQKEKAFWREVYKRYFKDNDEFYALLQDCCLYWNDDISIVMSFVMKLNNSVHPTSRYSELIRPPYTSPEEKAFASTLAYECMAHREAYTELISKYFRNWEKERVPEMDFLILRMAVTEAIHFPEIASRITINEALELARYYSAEENITYINGILHTLIEDLKKSGRILGA